jgi:hypothetical protein
MGKDNPLDIEELAQAPSSARVPLGFLESNPGADGYFYEPFVGDVGRDPLQLDSRVND